MQQPEIKPQCVRLVPKAPIFGKISRFRRNPEPAIFRKICQFWKSKIAKFPEKFGVLAEISGKFGTFGIIVLCIGSIPATIGGFPTKAPTFSTAVPFYVIIIIYINIIIIFKYINF